jgi:hypothetical protein
MPPTTKKRTVVASATQTASGVSGAIEAFGLRSFVLLTEITAASGTTPTVVFSVEWSYDGGATWYLPDPSADVFTSRSTASNWSRQVAARGDVYRVRWAIGGTTPSFTFAIHEVTL